MNLTSNIRETSSETQREHTEMLPEMLPAVLRRASTSSSVVLPAPLDPAKSETIKY